ncbi:MAG TPA: DUF3592 domain-containing protein [Enhygromyxa sp.]|nr:DUF3592 domain-containing protein [Enhygromyxa sp.]
MSKPRKASSPYFVLGLAVVCVLASTYPLYLAWQARRLGSASEPSTCEVLNKSVDTSTDSDGGTDGYYPVVEIAHTVDGQRHTRKDSGKRFLISSDAWQAIAHLQIGAEIPCRYVAGSPGDVVVFEQDPGQFRGMLLFGLCLWLMPIGVFVWERRLPGWRGP